MRPVAPMFAILLGGCVSASERGDFAPSASAPEVMSPGAVTTEAASPIASVTQQERCSPATLFQRFFHSDLLSPRLIHRRVLVVYSLQIQWRLEAVFCTKRT